MRSFLSSYAYFVIPLVSWVVAQIAKIVTRGIKSNDWNWRYIYRSGGMPSAHTTVIISLCSVLAYRVGTQSPEFGIACILAVIVMYDALNVRHAVGEHAEALQKMLPLVYKKQVPPMIVHQSYGHTPTEVGAGFIIGIVVPTLVFIVT